MVVLTGMDGCVDGGKLSCWRGGRAEVGGAKRLWAVMRRNVCGRNCVRVRVCFFAHAHRRSYFSYFT